MSNGQQRKFVLDHCCDGVFVAQDQIMISMINFVEVFWRLFSCLKGCGMIGTILLKCYDYLMILVRIISEYLWARCLLCAQWCDKVQCMLNQDFMCSEIDTIDRSRYPLTLQFLHTFLSRILSNFSTMSAAMCFWIHSSLSGSSTVAAQLKKFLESDYRPSLQGLWSIYTDRWVSQVFCCCFVILKNIWAMLNNLQTRPGLISAIVQRIPLNVLLHFTMLWLRQSHA